MIVRLTGFILLAFLISPTEAQNNNKSLILGSWKLVGTELAPWACSVLSFYADHTYQSKSCSGVPREYRIAQNLDSINYEGGKWEILNRSTRIGFKYIHRIPSKANDHSDDKKGTLRLLNDSMLVLQFSKWNIEHYKRILPEPKLEDNYSPKQFNCRDIELVSCKNPKRSIKLRGFIGPGFSIGLNVNPNDTFVVSKTVHLEVSLDLSSDTSMSCRIYIERIKTLRKDGTSSEIINDYTLKSPSINEVYSPIQRTINFSDINDITYPRGWVFTTYKLTTKKDTTGKDLWYLKKPID
jgi:hypothetical protein